MRAFPFPDRRWFWSVLVFDTHRDMVTFDAIHNDGVRRHHAGAVTIKALPDGTRRLGVLAFYRGAFNREYIAHEAVHAAAWTMFRLVRGFRKDVRLNGQNEEQLATITGWIVRAIEIEDERATRRGRQTTKGSRDGSSTSNSDRPGQAVPRQAGRHRQVRTRGR